MAINAPPSSFRRQFVDVDELLGEILTRHLTAIANALSKVGKTEPDLPKPAAPPTSPM